ncbi:cytochrome-b5 reductase [Ascoidea rubescens DSM 1968]|uniref:NADH-cytochrome b5 reductase n=1 Tax=Ascoidea rubescens DSM 1968 TaxID=1344418 RepID=A0A1D2VFR4_9ASCO|nr:NADH-cytochrome b5 reductase 2 [Ascoidea rubescens DSM 1968]ODV60360.1 NADH-cytochrome b5 reductase 2 [Ascoidea rubescens DSM 1968]
MSAKKFLVPSIIGLSAIGGYYYYSTILNKPTPKMAEKSCCAPAIKTFTGSDEWIDLNLKNIETLSHDTKRFSFDLPSKNHISGLTTASLVLAKGNGVVRPYTPVSPVDLKGEIDFVIKKYPDSKFGTYIFGLNPNDKVSFKGPFQKWKLEENQFNEITLLGGGTGITPLFQILQEVTLNPKDKTKINLFYGNKTAGDILLKDKIDEIAKAHPDQVKVTYFLDDLSDVGSGPQYQKGFITGDYLKENIPKPSNDHHIFVCGPDPLYKALSGTKKSKTEQGEVTGALAELGYTKDHVFKF